MQFSNRHDVQTYLASLTKQGVIVELGCGYGNGVISLDRGNTHRLPIFSIDPYLPYSDPLGGKYGTETYKMMLENTRGIGFAHLMQSALIAVRHWDRPIGLLWIDLSMTFDDLWPIAHAWEKWIVKDGYLAITGLEYNQLGTRQIYDNMSGYDKLLTEQRFVAVLRKQ